MEPNHRPHIRFRLQYVESEQAKLEPVTYGNTDQARSAPLCSGAKVKHTRNSWEACDSIARVQWCWTCQRFLKIYGMRNVVTTSVRSSALESRMSWPLAI